MQEFPNYGLRSHFIRLQRHFVINNLQKMVDLVECNIPETITIRMKFGSRTFG